MSIGWRVLALFCAFGILAACSSSNGLQDTARTPAGVESADPAQADAIMRIVEQAMADRHLRAVIVRVTEDGEEIVTRAVGESMTGVPATPDMHFRNGAVAISYISTVLLQLVDEGTVTLDDRVSRWLPDIPHTDRVTLGQLAQMTSGYPDYVIGNDEFANAIYADPFRSWTPEELLSYATSKPLLYEPGTNWNYAHTNYVILGLALEKITGKTVETLVQERILDPLQLDDTQATQTPAIPDPVLHAFSSERRQFLGIPPTTPFYEETSFWDPSWTITNGAVQTSNIYDLHDTAVAVGTGRLLSPESHRAMVSTDLRGRTHAQPGCATCAEQTEGYTYGLGVVISGDWLLQNPLFAGYSAVEAYLPDRKIAIAVAATYGPEAFADTGAYSNQAQALFREIGAQIAPDHAPPAPPG
ncbi:serine hydrolase domain-containing protein [Rhodococcus sp. NPDC003382]|uniref:serine hydrolase domain-containing protein n=1 Tax=unclassified Rhodococcus (in: high G+C Gram-positive bacteria) TaxID=192944 RepID=UPI0018CECF50|nr:MULTISPECIES: serine hydrolase domain-containing protein [unclassified Rhodococcus (in: high G+C Gram-positive bacteria)]MBH0122823.1 beta-lactamase family protein [Rhodococcus sp. CX]MCK8672885.1 beta-lactamase family protein [Rhodococcus sp. HM1]